VTSDAGPIKTAVAIETSALIVAYGRADAVVCDVSLHARAGSITVLLGPSGCGKTTLLRAIAGLERPRSGTVRLGNELVSGPDLWVPPQRRSVGMVFQDPSLFPHLTVASNIAFGLRGTERAQREARVTELLELVEMREFADRLPGTLSGGQQQRIALARSLAPEPAVLLLDEPFSALDANLRTQLRGDVARIVREVGVTTVFVTHDQDEAFVMGDTVGVMHEGRLRQLGAPDELYTRPADRWVAEFVGEANVLAATSADGFAGTVLGRVPLVATAASGRVAVLVRPEDVTVSAVTVSDKGTSDKGTPGVVEHLDFFGHDTRLAIRLVDGTLVVARMRSREGLHHGAQVAVAYAGGSAVSWPVA